MDGYAQMHAVDLRDAWFIKSFADLVNLRDQLKRHSNTLRQRHTEMFRSARSLPGESIKGKAMLLADAAFHIFCNALFSEVNNCAYQARIAPEWT